MEDKFLSALSMLLLGELLMKINPHKYLFHILPESTGQKMILFMSTVAASLFTQ